MAEMAGEGKGNALQAKASIDNSPARDEPLAVKLLAGK